MIEDTAYKRQTTFHGYRGTTKYWGSRCREVGEFCMSQGKDEYFGHGIYFFENDHQEAFNFARYARNISKSNICVIYAYVETERTLDFFDTQTYNSYINLVEKLVERYINEEQRPVFDEPFDCRIINDICTKEGYLLVRGPYTPKHKKGIAMRKKGYTRFQKTHIQLCVRDDSIIKDYEVYD